MLREIRDFGDAKGNLTVHQGSIERARWTQGRPETSSS